MSERKFDENKPVPARYSPAHIRYEFIARLASNGRKSISAQIDDLIFDRRSFPWRELLEKMRVQHRKLGIDDREFYHTDIRKKMGLATRHGPRRRLLPLE